MTPIEYTIKQKLSMIGASLRYKLASKQAHNHHRKGTKWLAIHQLSGQTRRGTP